MSIKNKRSIGKLRIASRQLSKENSYWMSKLKAPLERVCFPYDNYSELTTYDQYSIELPQEVCDRLSEISKGSDYSLHTFLMFSIHLLLQKYTGAEDLCLGTCIYNNQSNDDDLINIFLAVRSELDNKKSIKEALKDYAVNYKRDIDHQNYPLEVLLENLGYSLNDPNPCFDVLVLLKNIQSETFITGSDSNIQFLFERGDGDISLNLSYNKDCYEASTIVNLCDRFIFLLSGLVNNLDRSLGEVQLLTQEERNELIRLSTDELQNPIATKTIIDWFEENVERNPNKKAIEYGENSISYLELQQRVHKIAANLVEKGVGNKTRVGVLLESGINQISAVLGILKAGGSYVPIDISYPDKRKGYIINDSKMQFLVVDDSEESKRLEEYTTNLTKVSSEKLLVGDIPTADLPGITIDSEAYVIYTSGTTGEPKGVMINHANLSNYLKWACENYELNGAGSFPYYTSISFDLTVTSLFVPLIAGSSIHIYNSAHAESNIKKIISDDQVNIIKLTPSHLRIIKNLEPELFKEDSNLHTLIVGGEKFDTTLAKEIHDKFQGKVRIINEYGPTEATVGCMIHEYNPEKDNRGSVPIGVASNNNVIYLLDENLNMVPDGAVAEIFISGASLSKGYIGKDEITKEKFIDNPFCEGQKLYRTGDLAIRFDNDKYEYLRRADSQVKILGHRIELDEVKVQINSIAGVQDSVVVILEDRLIAYYTCNSDDVTKDTIQQKLEESLPSYMIPNIIIPLDKIPLTTNGKVDTSRLPAPSETNKKLVPPRNELDKRIIDILKSVLKIDTISIEDNLFKLGIDSIRTIQLAALIYKNINIRIEVSDFYEYPVIVNLSDYINDKMQKSDAANTGTTDEKASIENDIANFSNKYLEETKQRLKDFEVESVYPMSEIEKAMLYYSEVNKGAALYLEQNLYNINYVDFDINKFREVLSQLIQKHSTLRTGFDINNSLHIIYRSYTPPINEYDISDLDVDAQQQYIDEVRVRDRKEKANYTIPTLKITFFKIQEEQYIMLLQFHHAVMDGWSLHAFLVELNNAYVELVKRGELNLKPLKCTYHDNILQELSHKRNDDLKGYWVKELSGHKRFSFPKLVQNKENKEAVLVFETRGVEYIEKLEQFCEKHNITLQNLCFASYLYTLSLLSYDNDILVGHVTNSRPVCEDGEKLLGCFLNTVPFRANIEAGQVAIDYVKYIHQKRTHQKKYEIISLLDIKDAVGEKSTNQNPFFDTKFNFIDFHVVHDLNKYEIERKAGRDFHLPNFTIENTHCDFCIDLTGSKKFFASWVYSPDFIDETTVQSMLTNFMDILDFTVDNPNSSLTKSQFIKSTQNCVPRDFNDTAHDYPEDKGVVELFEEQVLRIPDSIALEYENEKITFEELNAKANQLARALMAMGIGKGDMVPIYFERCAEMVISIYAILKIQAAYLPLSTSYPKERIDYILEDCKARFILTHSQADINSPKINLIYLDNSDIYHGDSSNIGLSYDPTELAYIIYTSGSTGKPKGVMVEHKALTNRLMWMQNKYPMSQDDAILQKTTYAFDVSVWELLLGAITGARLCLLDPGDEKDPKAITNAIEKYNISTIHFVPSMFSAFNSFIDDSGNTSGLKSLKRIFTSGEALAPALVNRFNEGMAKSLGIQLINLYGPTEATVDVTYYDCPKEDTDLIPIGKPIHNTKMYVLDANLEQLPIGAIGELYIAGDGLARGYLNKPQLTEERFLNKTHNVEERIYKTGDLARWLPDGNIDYCGRIDNQVKLRGFRIELGEIEHHITLIDGIKEAIVVCVDEGSNKHLCAYYTSDSVFEASALRLELIKYLPEFMVPAYFVRIENVPVTSNGKIDFATLVKIKPHELEKSEKLVYARNGIEKQLVNIFSEVTNVEPTTIGIDTNFFEMGGNSINLLQMNLKVNDLFNKDIQINSLFAYPTIRQLASLIEGKVEQESNEEDEQKSIDVLDETMEILNNER